MPNRNTLICTVGTSLFYPNLANLDPDEGDSVRVGLKRAYNAKDWTDVAELLLQLDSSERICGAEINSVNDMVARGLVEPVNLRLLHSDTREGEQIAEVLMHYFRGAGWTVASRRVEGLQDDDPKMFRTLGLRNLVKVFGEGINETGGRPFCAINATGGYKAQVAIAVLMGQAMAIPVYYKHERFSEIIDFPPMPVALDLSLWRRASGMFVALAMPGSVEPASPFEEDWDERFEPLVNRETIDGVPYLELSAAGQVFHVACASEFREFGVQTLPPAANPDQKSLPRLGNHGYQQAEQPIREHLTRITDEVPYVLSCATTYWNRNLPQTSHFRLSGGEVQGIYSDGNWCVKFAVNTTAPEGSPLDHVVADLNQWRDRWQ